MIPSSITFVTKRFPGFYALRQHKDSQNDFPIRTANELDDTNLEEELRSINFSSWILNREDPDMKYSTMQ